MYEIPSKFPACPAVLTYNHWKSKKAALTPETGIGKALKKLEELVAGVKYANLVALPSIGEEEMKIAVVKSDAEADKLRKAIKQLETTIPKAEAEAKAIIPVKTHIQALFLMLKNKAVLAKKDGLFPKASRELIESMIDPCEKYQMRGILHFFARCSDCSIGPAKLRMKTLKARVVDFANL